MNKKGIMNSKTLLLVTSLFSGAAAVQAANINIPDFSFEGITASVSSPNGLSLGTNSGPIGAWSAQAGGLVGLNSSVASGTAGSLGAPAGADGNYVVGITLPVGAGASASLSQTLSDVFLPNSRYVLSLEIDPGTSANLLSGSSLQLEAGSTSVASLSGTDFLSLLNPNGTFQTVTLTYETGSAPPSGNIGIDFDANSVAGVGGKIFLDNFQLTVNPVPEPQPIALMSMGLLLAIGWAKYSARAKCIIEPAHSSFVFRSSTHGINFIRINPCCPSSFEASDNAELKNQKMAIPQ
jgi:hypothetical protein